VFCETLLDENATCHIAWGAGIPSVLPGWRSLTGDQLRDAGVNQSATHVDFMVGGPGVTVTGLYADGTQTLHPARRHMAATGRRDPLTTTPTARIRAAKCDPPEPDQPRRLRAGDRPRRSAQPEVQARLPDARPAERA